MRGLYGIITKEFKHILRDSRTLLILFVLPVLMMVLFGYAMTLEVRNIRLIIDDRDDSVQSRALAESFTGSGFFIAESRRVYESLKLFQRREGDALLTISQGYGSALARGDSPAAGLDIDASDANRAMIIRQYVMAQAARTLAFGQQPVRRVSLHPVFLYNSGLESTYFFVPALTALLIIMVAALLTSLTITREKEQGTFDLIKIAPVSATEIIIGKVVPYLLLSLLIGILIVAFGSLVFKVPLEGSPAALLLYLFLYCLTGLSFGMLISTIASSQQIAMLVALIATLLPTLFLSGFIFQIEAMPAALRIISSVVPAKYFLVILRGLMLKGNTQEELAFHIIMLLSFSSLFLVLSIARFKRYLEK
ncbi:MAG: ABC transporter permease [Spirochaetales bacterium]|nr:ABC transporter permease [Spirochaetales bacterium]